MIDEDDIQSSGSGEFLIIPIRGPGETDPEQVVLEESEIIRSILSGETVDPGSDSSSDDTTIEDRISNSILSFHSVSDDPDETLVMLEELSGISGDEALEYAAKCGAFWKSLGAETLIYMASYGGGLLANGLIIRFTGLDEMTGTLLFGSYAALSYHNAQLLFTSLVKPPEDRIPEDKQSIYKVLNQYAFLPVSWLISSAASGTALSLLGDASFGTQQAIGVPSALLIGPVTSGLQAITRECLGGSIEIHPDSEDVVTTFRNAYSPEPNPFDDDRSHRFGTLRKTFNRFIAVNLSTLALFAYGGTSLATYCIGGRDEFLNATANTNTTDVNDALNDFCAGGQVTYAFREIGLSVTYGLGVLVVEPILNGLLNRVYDCFYPRGEEQSDDEPLIEDLSDTDSSEV